MPDPAVLLASHRCATAPIAMHLCCSAHPHGLLYAVRQHIENYLVMEACAAPAYRYETPLTEEEITLLEEEVLPVIARFLRCSDAAHKAAERAQQEIEPTLATAERQRQLQRQGWGHAA